jgi:hypothetical protein
LVGRSQRAGCSPAENLKPFQPYLLSVPPSNRKHYGYGEWEVRCPKCNNKRMLKAHKYKNGKVRGEENLCHPCRAVQLQRRVSVKCPSCGVVRILGLADARERLSSYCQRCVKQTTGRKNTVKGHTNKTSRGYVLVLGMRGHPLAPRNTVHEHWLTLYDEHPMGPESVLWFKKQGFTVHHKNGVRDDNSLGNLELRAPGKHPAGWTIEEMEEVIRRYRATPQHIP